MSVRPAIVLNYFFVVDFKAHYRVKLRRYETIIGINTLNSLPKAKVELLSARLAALAQSYS